MMKRTWLTGLVCCLMTACAPDGERAFDAANEPSGLRGGPPPTVVFFHDLVAATGDDVTLFANVLAVSGPISGASVSFVASTGGLGAGACPPVLQGSCLDIVGDPRILGTVNTNNQGVASLIFSVPSAAPDTIFLQAVVRGGQRVALSTPSTLDVVDLGLQAGEVCQSDPQGCAPGLACCYPCGIQGCQNTCMEPCDPVEPWCMGGCPLFP
jgi:hypothetical protein